jgi:hypothetical protein
MSGLLAERYEHEAAMPRPYLRLVSETEVVAIPQLPEDEQVRSGAERRIRSIGLTAISNEVETLPENNDSLLSAIKRANAGDPDARSMVAVNVGSDFSERVLKAGEVTKYSLSKNGDGDLIQFGQLYSDVYANTLRHTVFQSKMRPRAEAEMRNAERIRYLHTNGKLTDNCVVVFSLAPDDMSDQEMADSGFFAETKTLSIQVTTDLHDGVSIESGFVAGVPEFGAQRLDLNVIIKVGDALGINYRNMSAAEILDTPLLIPKHLMPNGVIDLVKLYDDCAGGTFFGEQKPHEDYKAFREFCDERRRSFQADVKAVTDQLIKEADTLHSQLQAIQRLNDLSEAQMVKRAIQDNTINARVFGEASASYIEQARFHFEHGNIDLMLTAEHKAIQTADSSSCPSGVGRQSDINTERNESLEKMKDCDFISKKCPICGEKNAKTRVRKGVYFHVGKSCKA